VLTSRNTPKSTEVYITENDHAKIKSLHALAVQQIKQNNFDLLSLQNDDLVKAIATVLEIEKVDTAFAGKQLEDLNVAMKQSVSEFEKALEN
jgi:hypothetical protein